VKPAAAPDRTSVLGDLDTQLMLQVRAGNREAANTLIRRNFERIARYIGRVVGSVSPVEDLTQDVFLTAFSKADNYEPKAKVTTWLYRIATNKALNYLKQPHVKRRLPAPPEDGLDLPDRGALPPDARLSLDELKDKVSQALHGLPVNQRIAITLFEYEDCSYEQIASVLDVTVEAVRGLLTRARTAMRQQLRGLI
jgi:RNA polymerase sigma-70 factor (ECF subfamily)